jgi:hypothetical protein
LKCEPRAHAKCNCGGTTCKPFQQCINESCECPRGYSKDSSDSGCLSDLANDHHCGPAGADCTSAPSKTRCIGGKCSCPAGMAEVSNKCVTPCADEETLCRGKCVILGSNPDFCGNCRTACVAGEKCEDGSCRAPVSSAVTTAPTPVATPDFSGASSSPPAQPASGGAGTN